MMKLTQVFRAELHGFKAMSGGRPNRYDYYSFVEGHLILAHEARAEALVLLKYKTPRSLNMGLYSIQKIDGWRL